jgi:cytidylate kinase
VSTFAELARDILARPPRLGPVRLVAVDGPAGSGKTTFAGRLSGALTHEGARAPQVHVDDLLAGWGDLATFWPRLEQWVLDPLRRGMAAAYRSYDWHAEVFRDEWTTLGVPEALIVEGVSSARAVIRPELTLSVYLIADRDVRLTRGIERDGEALRPEWLRWMAEEDEHFARDDTMAHVDLLVDGMSNVAETEYVSVSG